MTENRAPRNWYWDARQKRWAITLGAKGVPAVSIGKDGLTVHIGALTYESEAVGSLMSADTLLITTGGTIPTLRVPTLASVQNLNVNTQGSVQNLSVGTLATMQAINVGATGTIRNLTVPTLASLRAIDVAGVGSLATANLTNVIMTTGTLTNINVGTLLAVQNENVGGIGSHASARIAQMKVGGGGTLTYFDCFTGTIALSAVGTNTVTVATISGLGSAGIAVGDLILVNAKAAIAGVMMGQGWIPTTNVVVVPVVNPSDIGGGSLPAVGVDVFVTRITKT